MTLFSREASEDLFFFFALQDDGGLDEDEQYAFILDQRAIGKEAIEDGDFAEGGDASFLFDFGGDSLAAEQESSSVGYADEGGERVGASLGQLDDLAANSKALKGADADLGYVEIEQYIAFVGGNGGGNVKADALAYDSRGGLGLGNALIRLNFETGNVSDIGLEGDVDRLTVDGGNMRGNKRFAAVMGLGGAHDEINLHGVEEGALHCEAGNGAGSTDGAGYGSAARGGPNEGILAEVDGSPVIIPDLAGGGRVETALVDVDKKIEVHSDVFKEIAIDNEESDFNGDEFFETGAQFIEESFYPAMGLAGLSHDKVIA